MSENTSPCNQDEKRAEQRRENNRRAQQEFRLRRKAHLNQLRAAQLHEINLQHEETERLRHENLSLIQANEFLRTVYSQGLPGPDPSLWYMGLSDSLEIPVSHPHLHGPTVFPSASVQIDTDPNLIPLDPSPGPLVLLAADIDEVRRSLHAFFIPIFDRLHTLSPRDHLLTLANLSSDLPRPLKPTLLQLSVPHHAYLDLIPSPTLRDRLITIGLDDCNEFLSEACTIACDIPNIGQMTVWGQDWMNESSWEFSAPVLEKWTGRSLTGEWTQRANFWRRQRGAPLLILNQGWTGFTHG